MRRIITTLSAAVGAAIVLSTPVTANEYPSKPVQLVVPWAAGGVLDSITRSLQPGMARNLGQQIVVENRSGANGTLGTAFAARAQADGYTVLMTIESHVINHALYRNLPFNPFDDFEPIALIGGGPMLLIANKDAPMNSVADIVRMAKEKPGSVSYASIGAGSQHHLVGLLLARKAGIEITHVPYRGGGPAMSDLAAGHVPLMFLSISGVLPLLQTGKVKAIAVFAPERVAQLPDVPTIAESGYPGIEAAVWFGALVPRGTPAPVRERLLAAVSEAVAMPDVQDRFAKLGLRTTLARSEEFRRVMKLDYEKYHEVAASLNLSLN
jgi:tripartite-type tricarboxylate transporter receptor subunit TctC